MCMAPELTALERILRALRELVLLLAAAMGVWAGLWALIRLELHFGLSLEMQLFVGGVLVYHVIAGHGLIRLRSFRRDRDWRTIFWIICVLESPVALSWLALRAGIVQAPMAMAPYVVGGVLLATAVVVFIDTRTRRLRKRERAQVDKQSK